MKKVFYLVPLLLLLVSCGNRQSFGKDVDTDNPLIIYAAIAQYLSDGGDDFLRYSPLNVFDNDDSTSYHTNYALSDRASDKSIHDFAIKKRPLLEIYFAEPAVFDTITVTSGKKNTRGYERLKNVRVVIRNCLNTDYDGEIELANSSREQALYSGDRIIATSIEIYATENYNSGYLVIGDINFYLDKVRKPVVAGNGKCLTGEIYHIYSYDDQDRLTSISSQYGHAGASAVFFKYEGDKILAGCINYEAEDEEPIEYYDTQLSDIRPAFWDNTKDYRYFDGKPVAEGIVDTPYDIPSPYMNQYIYDEDGKILYSIRIVEKSDLPISNRFTEYYYNEKGLLTEKIAYTDSTIYKKRYTEEDL